MVIRFLSEVSGERSYERVEILDLNWTNSDSSGGLLAGNEAGNTFA